MLTHLTIKNYALIRHLELEPSERLNVVTGETGAGKSIMLGALGLLLGNRVDTKVLWNDQEKCITEGVFNIRNYNLHKLFTDEELDYEDVTVIRREISPAGKSRAFINDTPVTLEVMKKIGSLLMDIHSQHETLQLGNQFFQLRLVDTFSQNQHLLDHYTTQWMIYQQAKKEFEKLTAEASTLRQEADYVRFQLDELTQANLEETEQETIESELKIMEHAEEIKGRFQLILDGLNRGEFAARNGLTIARTQLQQISSYSPTYETLFTRLDSLVIELDDIIEEIERAEELIEYDQERTEYIKERLSVLYRLFQKHRVTGSKELINLREALEEKNVITSNVDEALDQAQKKLKEAEHTLRTYGTQIRETRKKSFTPLTKQITELLQLLGIPNASLQIELTEIEPTATGLDKIELLFSANKGVAPRPLAQVASGGEFSRLMFCIKYVMAEKTAMPTLVLDEIDSGVSGEVAIKLGNLMKRMAANHQVISISHLPQIAAKADVHYLVYKDNSADKTVSIIKALAEEERVENIAKMIGGEKPSNIALQNAKELLAQ